MNNNPSLYIDLGERQAFPTVGANSSSDGEVILTLAAYPHQSMMTVPMWAAVELAEKIMWLANQNMKEAA